MGSIKDLRRLSSGRRSEIWRLYTCTIKSWAEILFLGAGLCQLCHHSGLITDKHSCENRQQTKDLIGSLNSHFIGGQALQRCNYLFTKIFISICFIILVIFTTTNYYYCHYYDMNCTIIPHIGFSGLMLKKFMKPSSRSWIIEFLEGFATLLINF